MQYRSSAVALSSYANHWVSQTPDDSTQSSPCSLLHTSPWEGQEIDCSLQSISRQMKTARRSDFASQTVAEHHDKRKNRMNTLNLQFQKITPLCCIVFTLACFAFSPQTQAACGSPDPGCPTGNLADGYLALSALAGGAWNTGIGTYSLTSNIAGNFNTGVGALTLFSNTSSSYNTATGYAALFSNTTGEQNTANGAFALTGNNGSNNTATGFQALVNNSAVVTRRTVITRSLTATLAMATRPPVLARFF